MRLLSISLFYWMNVVFSSKVLRHVRNRHWRNTSLFGFSQTRGVFWWNVWKGVSSCWTMSHSHFRRCGHWCDLHQLQNSHAEILKWSELIIKRFLLSLSKWYIFRFDSSFAQNTTTMLGGTRASLEDARNSSSILSAMIPSPRYAVKSTSVRYAECTIVFAPTRFGSKISSVRSLFFVNPASILEY